MKNCILHICVGVVLSHAPVAAYADSVQTTNSIPQENVPAQYGQQSNSVTIPPQATNQLILPKLAIRWDCSECTVNEKVAPLIEKTYADEAAKDGYIVSTDDTAEMVITDFRQRPPGTRVMLGIFAGKDRLGVRIFYRGNEREASDYSANAWFGMNSLCESVAKKSVAELLSIIQLGQTTEQTTPAN